MISTRYVGLKMINEMIPEKLKKKMFYALKWKRQVNCGKGVP